MLDRLAPPVIAGLLLPLMRGGAAALAAQGSSVDFAAGIGADPGQVARCGPLLAWFERRRVAFDARSREWERAFFGPDPVSSRSLVAAEKARRRAAVALYEPQAGLLTRRKSIPALRPAVAGPEEVDQKQGARLAKGAAPFPVPASADVKTSRAVQGPYGREYWIRFRSPILGDCVTARVYEPLDVPDPPSLIFLHGVAMEPEFWPDRADPVNLLARRGVRVICPRGALARPAAAGGLVRRRTGAGTGAARISGTLRGLECRNRPDH